MRTGTVGRWFMVAATLIIGGVFTSGIAIGQEAKCPCFDANELKDEIRFVEEMAANGGVFKQRKLDVEKNLEEQYEAYMEVSALVPDDTEVHARVYESLWPTKNYRCGHSFFYLDDLLKSAEAFYLTGEQVEVCVVEMTEAFGKLLKDVH